MTFEELKKELSLVIYDPRAKDYLQKWINDAIYDIATEIDLPALRRVEPFAYPVTNSKWLYDLPEIYHKKLFACKNNSGGSVNIYDNLDAIALAEHTAGDSVQNIAVCDIRRQLACSPMANDVLFMWFYNKPEHLIADTDVIRCIPEPYQTKVIIPKVVIMHYKTMIDLSIKPPIESIVFWELKYKEGLYGSERGDIGMINYFASRRRIRRHGGYDPLP